MKNKHRMFLQEWLFLVVAWIIYMSLGLLIIIAMEDFIDYKELDAYGRSWYAYLENIIFGFSFGTLFAFINRFTESDKIRQMSFGRIIVLKSILYILAAGLVGAFITGFYLTIGVFDLEFIGMFYEKYASIQPLIAVLLYGGFFIILTNFLLQVNKKLGPGTIWNLMKGKYHKPQSENRIFMFLDLKNSTGIAESLGHHQYSLMIRKCFHDLTNIIIECKAEVYQYVGDEVVLTWPVSAGIKDLNCLNLFFKFQEKLQNNSNSYLKEFGIAPEFKAGLELGTVTVAEIGELKQEIAYHGDVVNTAARIQGRCNYFGQPLLISENLLAVLPKEDFSHYRADFVGNVTLKGKLNNIDIYAIQKSEQAQELKTEMI